jgi:hypothetical protein
MQPCLPKFNTGDILLYNTTKHWYSRLIERFTHSDYSDNVGQTNRNVLMLSPLVCTISSYNYYSRSIRTPVDS